MFVKVNDGKQERIEGRRRQRGDVAVAVQRESLPYSISEIKAAAVALNKTRRGMSLLYEVEEINVRRGIPGSPPSNQNPIMLFVLPSTFPARDVNHSTHTTHTLIIHTHTRR